MDGGEVEAMGDMEGNFSIQVPVQSQKLIIKAYTYLDAELNFFDSDSAKAYMYYAHPFTFQTITTSPARRIVKSILRNRKFSDPRSERNYKYQSYNKIVVTTNYISALKVYLEGLTSFFGNGRMTSFGSDHHILLMESSSIRKFRSEYNQKESVVFSKVSGINTPPALSLVSGFEPLSIFEPFLRIGSKKYISPLAGRPSKRYIYFLQDSIKTKERTIYVIKFNPKSHRNKELLQGFLYVSTDPIGIVGFQIWPAYDRESTFNLIQKAEVLPSGRWFPSQIKTTYKREKLGALKIPIDASSKTYIFNHSNLQNSDSIRFNEVIFDFQNDSLIKAKEFPARLRQEELTLKDKNTYLFYNQIGSLKAIDRYLSFGQKLISGRIPFGRLDMVLNNSVSVNEVEGMRLGFGLQSTEIWSQKHQGGGYFAYGFKDEKWKFGLNYGYFFSDKLSLTLNYKSDLVEPGIKEFVFNKKQYPSEQLRVIRIPRFDKVKSTEIGFNHQMAKNLVSRVSFEFGRRSYLFNYRFLDQPIASGLGISEFKSTIHWSPGEQFIRYGRDRLSLGSDFPGFWLEISKGLRGVASESYSYLRIEGKVQWSKKILGLGEIGIQVVAGKITSRLPYSLLFTARGSYREITILSYNTFETMRYNEFINNRFVNVFFSHKFSKMQISTLPYRPYFTFLQNMGWGELANPQLHEGIKVKGMPKGYFESGLFLNDLFSIPINSLNLGVGGGVFLRYGPYALDGYLNNIAIKFSATLGF